MAYETIIQPLDAETELLEQVKNDEQAWHDQQRRIKDLRRMMTRRRDIEKMFPCRYAYIHCTTQYRILLTLCGYGEALRAPEFNVICGHPDAPMLSYKDIPRIIGSCKDCPALQYIGKCPEGCTLE